MNANLADPHWTYVWPAYGLAAVGLLGLTLWTVARARRWSRRAKQEEER